jgi:hypothetical protein
MLSFSHLAFELFLSFFENIFLIAKLGMVVIVISTLTDYIFFIIMSSLQDFLSRDCINFTIITPLRG